MPAVSVTTVGDVIANRYRLVTKIAVGGMGLVWEAWDELLLRRVAVKQLLTQPGLGDDEVVLARNRVIREARITARLHHPNAVTLYDVVDQDGYPCLIMQFVPSISLSGLLHEHGPLPPAVVSRIGADVASALVAAHAVGIVHRDVKPGNVLITDDGSAKLTDFGISHAVGDITLTATGMVSGTPAYLAPEVARGAESGFPADVFSLGSTLYAALEGAPPFGIDPNPMAILHRVGTGRIDPPRRSGPLTPLLLRMLVAEPADRPVMLEVARTLAGRPIEVRTLQDVPPTAVISAQTIREPVPQRMSMDTHRPAVRGDQHTAPAGLDRPQRSPTTRRGPRRRDGRDSGCHRDRIRACSGIATLRRLRSSARRNPTATRPHRDRPSLIRGGNVRAGADSGQLRSPVVGRGVEPAHLAVRTASAARQHPLQARQQQARQNSPPRHRPSSRRRRRRHRPQRLISLPR